MSTNSPEEAHEETEIPWPARMDDSSTQKDSGEQPPNDVSTKAESSGA
ncbi:hypothetical protein [uncultured Microbacterium sp.]|nr:hypothetical protein [uncultured Microbacterium sp.]